MRSMGSGDVDQAVAEMVQALTPYASQNWQVRAGSLQWSCWSTAAHVAHDLVAYTGQLAAQPVSGYLPFDLVVRQGASPGDVLQVVIASGRLLGNALAAAGPDARAWHWGSTDPGGFAALGVNETIVHTYDITQGLGIGWLPPETLCAKVLARLFPDAPDGDPGQVLLWCTGRADLDDRPHVTSWIPKAAVD
jgi:Mycothiol maleylpyruvate isomerase N-terminal domain